MLAILEKAHRCSSMVENLHSRLRPYLAERKTVSQKILRLLQFYLNHKPFMRSRHERFNNKTAAEAMTGKPHLPWLEMLRFACFKQRAARLNSGFTKNVSKIAPLSGRPDALRLVGG